MSKPQISVVLSTYNQPEWLQKVLWGYAHQEFTDFEVIIADDGSTNETKALIETMRGELPFQITHVWHEDKGFQKTIILNTAIKAASADYLLFSDGDCIPRSDFVAVHATHRESGYFLSGGYFKLPMEISKAITQQDIQQQRCFDVTWLKGQGLKSSFKNNKLTTNTAKQKFLNWITPTEATWNGHNSSGWLSDILAANGFDQRMQYGGEDRELGERLFNAGIKAKQLRYTAICVHLDHPRGYVKPEMLTKNAAIRKTTKDQKLTRTAYGLDAEKA
ncbi:glycosyltransferase family 2 protein [Gilvibacter sediminis]|uniref:glycosyltransferase family 2 protein n=1 Tax=Gilvibacter sediminis TaxID=379071 RepID=UPI0023500A10|nr:glycosyltransferase family 2 protein [Gilvibacter sediminis]MDC7998872.1 glycosyltransferase family 2 protein [Gilvibacter sediminis]